jgi:hypothetical protein
MPAYYAMGYLSGVLFSVTTIGEHPHVKTPNARHELLLEAEARDEPTLEAVSSRPFIGRQSCFQCTVHSWQVAVRESRHMHPQRTSIHAQARDACEHTLDSAGALAFVNDSSGSAAPPAPYHASAARQLACPFSPLSHTRGDDA